MISNKTVRVTRIEKYEAELNGVDIVELLRKAGHNIPEGATVYFAVPGGGDWSNTSIDITTEHPLRIEWKITEERDA